MFWVLDVDFLRAGVVIVGVEADAEGVPFPMLHFRLSPTGEKVLVVDRDLWAVLKKNGRR